METRRWVYVDSWTHKVVGIMCAINPWNEHGGVNRMFYQIDGPTYENQAGEQFTWIGPEPRAGDVVTHARTRAHLPFYTAAQHVALETFRLLAELEANTEALGEG